MNELFRLMEETDSDAVKESSSYKALSGLEHQEFCFQVPEGTGSVPCEGDLEVSTCEDVRTISNCSDCWRRWWWLQRCCFLQNGEQSASDIGAFWEVFDEMSSTQSTSAPPCPKLDCAKSDSECSYKPYTSVPPSPASPSSHSKSTRSSSPSPVYALKQKCPKIKIFARSLNKDLKNNQAQQCNQVRCWVTHV